MLSHFPAGNLGDTVCQKLLESRLRGDLLRFTFRESRSYAVSYAVDSRNRFNRHTIHSMSMALTHSRGNMDDLVMGTLLGDLITEVIGQVSVRLHLEKVVKHNSVVTVLGVTCSVCAPSQNEAPTQCRYTHQRDSSPWSPC